MKKTVQTVQDLKNEIEVIKKTQTKGILNTENLSKQTGNTEASITNRIQEMEGEESTIEIIGQRKPRISP